MSEVVLLCSHACTHATRCLHLGGDLTVNVGKPSVEQCIPFTGFSQSLCSDRKGKLSSAEWLGLVIQIEALRSHYLLRIVALVGYLSRKYHGRWASTVTVSTPNCQGTCEVSQCNILPSHSGRCSGLFELKFFLSLCENLCWMEISFLYRECIRGTDVASVAHSR